MLGIQVNLSEIQQVQDRIDKLGRKLYQFDAVLEAIGKTVTEYYAGPAFDSQGGAFARSADNPDGGRWPALSPYYALYKAKKLRTPIMVGTSSPHMRDMFTYATDDTSVTIGNTSPHFVYHQSTEPRTRLPRRQMIGMNETIKGMIAEIVENDIRTKIGDI